MKMINPPPSLCFDRLSIRPERAKRVEGLGTSRTIKFFTLGCKVNQYETQEIRERFIDAGFKEVNSNKRADIYIINTCTVTATADRKSRYFIHLAHRQNSQAKIIVTGCYTGLNNAEIAKVKGVTHIVKNQDKNKIIELPGNKKDVGFLNEYKHRGISSFSGHTRAFLKIQDGCDNHCSYCKVPLVRGTSRSKPLDHIILEAGRLVKNGFKEITLCGICLGSYGRDLQPRVTLVDVVQALEAQAGLLRIRLSSIEAGDITDALINKMVQSKKLCRHLHIPIQSGDDEILKKMNRSYSRQDYLNLINKIKKQIPKIAITTDIMVGFPQEGTANFNNTVSLVKEILPVKAHIFPYSLRDGTAASYYKNNIDCAVVKERILHLERVAKECAFIYKKQFLGKNMPVLFEGRSKENKVYWEGYTDNYIRVWVKSSPELKNQVIITRLKRINPDYMLAELA